MILSKSLQLLGSCFEAAQLVRTGGDRQKRLHDGHRRKLMSNSIVITGRITSVLKRRKTRIAGQLEHLRRDYIDKLAYSEVNWNGDTADLRVGAFGQTVTGKICVMSDSVRIEVQLPDSCRPHRQDPRRSEEQRGGIAADRAHSAEGLSWIICSNPRVCAGRALLAWRSSHRKL
jgi:hypothetical protein